MLRLVLHTGLSVLILGSFAGVVGAEELRLGAPALMEQAVTRHVKLSASSAALQLSSGVLYEDDGPAAGFCYGPNEERLGPGIKIRKELLIADPRCESATLLVGQGGTLQAEINGQPVELRPSETNEGKAGNYWQEYSFEPSVLRAGKNEIVLSGTGKVWIARDQDYAAGSRERTRHPNRSAKSADGGKTWTDDLLGTKDDLDGEYYVRLFLDQYQPAGAVLLPVIDLGNLSSKPIAPAITTLGPLEIDVGATLEKDTKIVLAVRTGTTFVPDKEHWSAWHTLPEFKATIERPTGRFVQLRLELSTTFAGVSPLLREVVLRANPTVADAWSQKVLISESTNPRIVRSSIPFEYEPLDHPRLKQLREKYQLDDVVAGAKDELELVSKLAVWSSRRWEKGHLGQVYPAWDAFDILAPHTDGKPVGGFCQQFNLVFLQACASFGFVGRAVSIGPGDNRIGGRSGHEVVEIWLNQFGKWAYIDGDAAWYFVDPASRTPLSLRELHERQQAFVWHKEPPRVELVKLAETKYEWKGLDAFPPFAELRLIPRSNFLSEKSPLPLNQGMRGWFWTGHYVWQSQRAPAALLYGNRIDLARDWDWTLNQAHIQLEATDTPGELRVWLDSETPSIETFLVALDGGDAKKASADFIWKLHAGKNRLEARTRNVAGREGIRSVVVLDYGG